MVDYSDDDLSGSSFEQVRLTGSRFRFADFRDTDIRSALFGGARMRDVDFRDVVMRGVAMTDVDVTGEIISLRVNGVDVVPLIEAELNRRDPDRALMRPT